MKIVFMGTPAFALPTLAALHESQHEIVAVYTQPPRPAGRGQKDTPSPVHEFSLKYALPVYTPVSLKTPEAQTEFAAHKADIAVVVAYGLLLPKPILEAFPFGCINAHPSLLPRWRGAAPIQRTIMAGDRETGIVIMQMDAGLDTGDMLTVEKYPIAHGTNAGTLHDTLAQKAGPLVLKTLQGLQQKTIAPIKQSDTPVEYAKKITKTEAKLDFSEPAEAIYHKILGLAPHPGAWFEHNGERIKILNASLTAPNDFPISCNPGIIYPTELQREGKRRMGIQEFLTGFKL